MSTTIDRDTLRMQMGGWVGGLIGEWMDGCFSLAPQHFYCCFITAVFFI